MSKHTRIFKNWVLHKTIEINGEWSWLYAAIDIDSKLLLGVDLFERRGTDPATESLQQLSEKHDLTDTEFLVDSYGYLTAIFRLDLSGYLDYLDRNLIEKWFHTLKMRVSPPAERLLNTASIFSTTLLTGACEASTTRLNTERESGSE